MSVNWWSRCSCTTQDVSSIGSVFCFKTYLPHAESIPLQSCWRIQRIHYKVAGESGGSITKLVKNPEEFHYKVGEESGGIVSRFHKVRPTFFSFRTCKSLSTTLVAWIFSRDYLSHKKHLYLALSSFYMFQPA